MYKAYLKVEDKGKGMFSNERILHARDYNGNEMSGFFDKTNIKKGRLEVSVVGEEADGMLIVTPQLFLERNSMMYVRQSDLVLQ